MTPELTRCLALAVCSGAFPHDLDAQVESTLDALIRMAREGGAPPVASVIDDGAFEPTTRFRGRTLFEWCTHLGDADYQGTAAPARRAFLDMGAPAVPFLLASMVIIDWDDTASIHPRQVLQAMGSEAVRPLSELLESNQVIYAWMVMKDVIDRLRVEASSLARAGKGPDEINDLWGKLVRSLTQRLRSRQSATRLAALDLLNWAAMGRRLEEPGWGSVATSAKSMLKNDREPAVRGEACRLLASLGRAGIAGGLSVADLKRLAHGGGSDKDFDFSLPPEVGRAIIEGILMSEVANRKGSQPSPSGR